MKPSSPAPRPSTSSMKPWLALARLIDAVNERVGRAVTWLVLAATLISAANAGARYGFNLSSNAWLEIQWYLFGAIVLLAAGYTLKHNGHVRIDVIYGRFSARAGVDRSPRGIAVPAAVVRTHGMAVLARLRGISSERRDLARCRRAAPLAGAPVDPARIYAARAARNIGSHQAHRLPRPLFRTRLYLLRPWSRSRGRKTHA